MSTNYKLKINNAVANLSPQAAGGTYCKLMYDKTFTLPDVGYAGGTKNYLNPQVMSGYDHIGGGFWGVPLTTPYYCNGSNSVFARPEFDTVKVIPFADANTCPIPSLQAVTGAPNGYTRIFPTAADTTNNAGTKCYYHTLAGLSSGTNVTISYSSGNLVIKGGSTTWLSTAAQPYILLDIQAPGGKGGKGSYSEYNGIINSNDAVGVAGGGGGGSGGYLYLCAKANSGTITITVYNDYYKIKSSGSSDYIKMTKGGDGEDGWTSASQKSASAAGGSKGAGGETNMYNSSGTLLWSGSQICEEILGNFCVIEAIEGSSGGNGSASKATGTFSTSKAGTTGGSAPLTSMWLMNHPKWVDVGCGGSAGRGEQSSSCAAFAGGGGGAAAVVGSGSSHTGSGFSTTGEGAGGCGESGWTSMSSTGGAAGGNGALRVYYLATS